MNKKVLITAGPTYEPIDPVRYIGNHSSGKMGYAIAEAFASFGAQVTLVSGPTALKTKLDGIGVISVKTAKEMYTASKKAVEDADI
ncbi:MAG TPA: phosphopantothenoylcysteine decarboxylase, partial [Bacteroidales bacterium]|nr:phosphopantothenoylcysteine decarboxylase [Bacteroidales bacterium]